MNRFEHRSILFDVTRGRVPKIAYLQKVIGFLAAYGINQVQIYMEHTFKYSFFEGTDLEEQAYEGYNAADIRALDDYCYSVGVELIPCIATFGHLFEVLQSERYSHLCELPRIESKVYSWMDRQLHHTIDCSNPESLELIQQMIGEMTSSYRSPYLNICGDETYDIGKGKGRNHIDSMGQTEAYVDFLNKILESVRANGKTPMYWGDVILKHPEQMHHIHEDAVPMHWWYEEEVDEDEFKVLHKLGRGYYTCPGTVGWNHFINHYERSLINVDKMLNYGKAYGAVGGLITDWGDFGHVNHLSMSMPMMVYGALRMADMDQDMNRWYEEILQEDFYEIIYAGGNERVVTFETIMKWYYGHYNDDQAYGDSVEELMGISYEALAASYQRINDLSNELELLQVEVLNELMPTKAEIANSFSGMKWMLELVCFIKEKVYKQPKELQSELVLDTNHLESRIRMWYQIFSRIWLKDNRSSELFRVEEVIARICDFIRINS